MMEAFGETQQELMKVLLREKYGRTIDGLVDDLRITRTAVSQHLSSLERLGYIERGVPQNTGGRPVQVFRLSSKGHDLFPKQYSWFSELMIAAIKKDRGSDGLQKWMEELGRAVAATLEERLKGRDFPSRLKEIEKVMNELAYDAKAANNSTIEASNCVYHNLASRFPEVCKFDISLLKKLTGANVDHHSCIVRGDNICRFKIKK